MKNVGILMIMIATIGLGSCSRSPKANLKTEVDSLSYFFGVSRTEGIINYLTMQARIDTAYIDDFIRGFNKGAADYGPEEVAYLEGMRIAHMINNQWIPNINRDVFLGDSTKTINREAVLAGFYHGVKRPDDMKVMRAQTYANMKMSEIKEQTKLEKYGANKDAGEKFLADKKQIDGIKTTASGLQYKVIAEGKGEIPTEKSKVKVNYRGTLIDGTEFDSSKDAPASFRVSQLIKGWGEALTLMPVGSKWELYVPQELAYGSGEQRNIPPYSALIFEVELVEIEDTK